MRRRGVGRYVRTLAHLRPGQVASRIRLRALRRAVRHRPDAFERRWTRSAADAPGWPAGFEPLDAGRFDSAALAGEIEQRRFTLLNASTTIDGDWEDVEQPQLWRFHLQYWDWIWNVVAHRDPADTNAVVDRLYRDWSASTTYGRLDAWAAYTVALRLWTWCGLVGRLPRDSEVRAALAADIGRHAGFLRANLETDVGANHLIKNLKALVGAAVFLDDADLLREGLGDLTDQLAVQVLDDGGHYELSPSYHAQVLGDLIDVSNLLGAAGRSQPPELGDTIGAMRAWLAALVGPDGEIPVLNDGSALDAAELARLGVPAAPGERLTHLAASGYVVCRPRPDVQVVIDVGDPGPAEQPGHAHADCLSFELVVGDARVVIDAGTSEYGTTVRRQYERSTRAHNTVEIDGTDQTEVWGAFRAGRRARPTVREVVDAGDRLVVEAEHDGYRALGGRPRHRRRFEISEHGMDVTDLVVGGGAHRVVSRIRVPAPAPATGDPPTLSAGDGRLRIAADRPLDIADELHARRFGALDPSVVASVSADGDLPTVFRWSLDWA